MHHTELRVLLIAVAKNFAAIKYRPVVLKFIGFCLQETDTCEIILLFEFFEITEAFEDLRALAEEVT